MRSQKLDINYCMHADSQCQVHVNTRVGTSSRRAKEAWLDLFLQVVDKHVPLKQHRVKYKTQPQWISPEILDAIKCRDRHKSIGNENEYKLWRNKVIKLIQKSKKISIKHS